MDRLYSARANQWEYMQPAVVTEFADLESALDAVVPIEGCVKFSLLSSSRQIRFRFGDGTE